MSKSIWAGPSPHRDTLFWLFHFLKSVKINLGSPPPSPLQFVECPTDMMFFFFDASPNKTYLSTDLQLTTPPYYYKQHVQKSSCKNLLDAKFLRFGHSIAYPRNGEKGEKIFMKISLFSNYFVLSNLPEELPVTNF